jgi:hypothetical protein
MAQALIQRSFAGGEIAPALYGRADQAKYQTGLKTCRNFYIRKEGGVTNRPGSGLVEEIKVSATGAYFITFIYNNSQTYVIEAGAGYFRFYRNGAQIVVSGVAAYNGATAYVIGDLVVSGGVNYYCIAATTGNAPPNATYWYALTSDIYEIPTPYALADIPLIKFVQSADIVTLTHPTYDQRELTRTAHTNWKLQTITFAPSISAPTGLANTGAAGATYTYAVTAVKSETYEESLQSANTTTSSVASAGAPVTITWAAVTGAQEYNVYKVLNGVYGYIGVAVGTSFADTGITSDVTNTPPVTRNPFSGSGNFPATAGYYQQRRLFGRTDNAIEKIWTTRSGMSKNLTISSPLQSDDAVTFSLVGRKVSEIRHLFDIGVLVVLTSTGEWIVEGDADGILRADQPPNPRQIGYNGSADLMPLVITDSLLYVQARGTIVRDLRNEVSSTGKSAYTGRDLTVFATHLFLGYSISRWAFAQVPNSIIWAVRSDGALLSLTYLREHEIWGWSIHDTDGVYEDICVVPEGSDDVVYAIVKRTINGATKRYIERFPSRQFTNILTDAIFLDSYLTYDGRNTGSRTMTLSTGATWTVDDTITVTSSTGYFVAGDVGNDIVFTDADYNITLAINITGYTSATVVTGTPSKTVPVALRSTATTAWGKAVDQLSGLDHLEAKDVGVFADGNVVANPNNDAYEVITVAAGAIALDRRYLIIHVGLPYLCDFETLDLDVEGTQVRNKKKDITAIDLILLESRGVFAGPDFDTLDEMVAEPISDYDSPWPLVSGLVSMPIASTWENNGSFVVRQKDPLPLTILAAIPNGDIGG